jgi:hypothetical protein
MGFWNTRLPEHTPAAACDRWKEKQSLSLKKREKIDGKDNGNPNHGALRGFDFGYGM